MGTVQTKFEKFLNSKKNDSRKVVQEFAEKPLEKAGGFWITNGDFVTPHPLSYWFLEKLSSDLVDMISGDRRQLPHFEGQAEQIYTHFVMAAQSIANSVAENEV